MAKKSRFNTKRSSTHQIKTKNWRKYTDVLKQLSDTASNKLKDYIIEGHTEQETLDYAYALVQRYGEASAEMACQMYEALAEYSGAMVPAAEPASVATYGETAKAIRGTMMRTKDAATIAASAGRYVKLASVDTMMKNALRDGAEWAWIPAGDSCAFCTMLASRGWVKASEDLIENGHMTHIHSNCDCTFCVRHSKDVTVEGYDPDALYEEYINAGDTKWERLNGLRRQHYTAKRDYINAQKRAAYSKRQIRKTINKLEEEAARWEKKLTEQEITSIKKYAFNPGDKSPNKFYERMNAMLRGERNVELNIQRHAENISSGLHKFRIEEDFYVYRRVDYDPTKGIGEGDLIVGEQFLSTSVDPEKALKKEYLIKIRIKKGTVAAYIDSLSEFDQTELLIDKDAIFRVKSIGEKETLWEVVV